MANERVTIQVESNIGEDGPLTVMDTLHQFMDGFELLSAAISQEPGGEKVKWRLVSLSKNSPATATAEAFSADPAVPVGPLVHRGKIRFARGLASLSDGEVSPWIEHHCKLAKSMFARNLNGVGRTVFDLDDGSPRTVVVEKIARRAIQAIETHESKKVGADLSRSEFGTIDAHVAETRTWNGRPALYVKDRLSGKTFPCVLSDALAEKVGPTHSWTDAWSGRRVRIQGEIFYDRDGAISRVAARNIIDVNPEPVDLADLRNINLLDGRTPQEHIDRLWGYSDD